MVLVLEFVAAVTNPSGTGFRLYVQWLQNNGTPLTLAAGRGHRALVQVLIGLGADGSKLRAVSAYLQCHVVLSWPGLQIIRYLLCPFSPVRWSRVFVSVILCPVVAG
jgi:hypothetical protein